MGRKEDALIEFYSQPEHFADLANGWLFGGTDYLKSEELSDADRREEHSSGLKGRKKEMRHRYRDIFKEARSLSIRLLIGAELQEYVDYTMPLRIMDLDVLSYLRQKKSIASRHKIKDYRWESEYLSGFLKSDRLIPVVTLVLYLGEQPWDGARSLHEMMDLTKFPSALRNRIKNYEIDVLDVQHTSDEELRKFPSDVRFMLLFIKHSKDKKALSDLKNLCGQESVSTDTFETLANYVDEPALLDWSQKQEKGDERNMCEGIRALVEDGRNDGLRLGKAEGESRVNCLINLLLENDRIDDIKRAVKDKKYQNKLFAEFQL